jgi:transcription elongation factor Elf1
MGIPVASGYEKKEQGEWPPISAYDWEAESWDCPSCNSLLLAIVCIDAYGTRDTDFAYCPICGDRSKRIYSSHWPEVRCLIKGSDRLTESEADALV